MARLDIKCQKIYHGFLLDVNLDFRPSFTAIFGHSGAGKTTMLNLISGLNRVDHGTITWDGATLSDCSNNVHIPPHKRDIGYIFQDNRLFPHKSILANLKYGLKYTTKEKRRFPIDEVISVLGLEPFLYRKPNTISGGEKQRVTLGMALLASPNLLLMDEPLAALDKNTKLRFLSYIREIHSYFGLPILYVSHDIATIINFAKDAIVLDTGKVIAFDEARKVLLENSKTLISGEVENLFEAKVIERDQKNGIAKLDLGEFSLIVPDAEWKNDDKLMVEIPSSEIILATSKPESISARNILKGTIESVHIVGNRCLIDIDIGKRITAEILQHTKTELGLTTGSKIYVIIKAKCIHQI